jgi:tRNA U55 pseudouridine synthase TruB
MVADLEEALNYYEHENKVERQYENQWTDEYDAEVSEIAEWVKERVEDGDYTDPVRVSKNMMLKLQAIVEDYFKVIRTGREYNQKILEALEHLHGEENEAKNILHKYKEENNMEKVEEMLQITEKIYEIVDEAQNNFEQAIAFLDEAEEKLLDQK